MLPHRHQSKLQLSPRDIPSLSHRIPGAAQMVSSSQRCETRQEFIFTWENKFHHSQRMLHTCPDTALQESFPFACFPYSFILDLSLN